MLDWAESVTSEPDEVHVFLGRLDGSLHPSAGGQDPTPGAGSGGRAERPHQAQITQAAVRWLLGQLMGCARDEVRLRFDSYGRPVLADGSLHLGVSRDADYLLVAIARARLAASVHWVPPAYDDAALAPLTAVEQRLLSCLPAEARTSFITRLWTRKDAALRLCRRRLSGADQVEVLVEGGSGTVLVPDGSGNATVVVTDLPGVDNTVAAVATWHRPRAVRFWPVTYGNEIACQPAAVGGPPVPVSMNPLNSRQISRAGL